MIRPTLTILLGLLVCMAAAIYPGDERRQLESGTVPPFDQGYPSYQNALVGDFPTWPGEWFSAVLENADDGREAEAWLRLIGAGEEAPAPKGDRTVRLDLAEPVVRGLNEGLPLDTERAEVLIGPAEALLGHVEQMGQDAGPERALLTYLMSYRDGAALDALYPGFATDASELIVLMPEFRTDPRMLLLIAQERINQGEDAEAFAALVFADHAIQLQDAPQVFDLAREVATEERLRGNSLGMTAEEKRVERLVLLDLEEQARLVRQERKAFIQAMVSEGRVPGEPGFWEGYREYPRIPESRLRARYGTMPPLLLAGVVVVLVLTLFVLWRVIRRVRGAGPG